MDMDADKVWKIVGYNKRFINPFIEPCSYYIWLDEHGKYESIDESVIELYWEKLKYISQNIEFLVQQAFKPVYYESYAVNRKVVLSSDAMCQQLLVESFVLAPQYKTIGSCLSNSNFMPGHFIDCQWDYEWNLMYSDIC
ncbi:MAG: hypothetical protein J6C64_04465 [Lachnospiraceae bacterium]|nr:hypothetical protein [Lachnospiraceae bacterium]